MGIPMGRPMARPMERPMGIPIGRPMGRPMGIHIFVFYLFDGGGKTQWLLLLIVATLGLFGICWESE